MEQSKGRIEDYLYKDERNNISKVVDKNKKNAKLAILEYEVLNYDEKRNLSLIKIDLKTGRHHQIRVQFANLGHGLYGDQKYGTRGKGKQIRLWAYKICFIHPVSNEKMNFTSIPDWSMCKLMES